MATARRRAAMMQPGAEVAPWVRMARATDLTTPDTVPTTPSTPSTTATSEPPSQRRIGWVIGVTLAALAVLIVVILYAIDVF